MLTGIQEQHQFHFVFSSSSRELRVVVVLVHHLVYLLHEFLHVGDLHVVFGINILPLVEVTEYHPLGIQDGLLVDTEPLEVVSKALS